MQAVAKAVGVEPGEVVSPTFVLVHEYRIEQGSGFRVQGSESSTFDPVPGHQTPQPPASNHAGLQPPTSSPQPPTSSSQPPVSSPQSPVSIIYHLDAYRIRNEEEFRDLGPEEFFESSGWTFVEWADRVAGCLPPDYLRIEIEVMGAEQRRITATATGPFLPSAVDRLRASLALPS